MAGRKPEWQAVSFQPYQFNNLASFGTAEDEADQYTGITKPKFKKLFSLHYARRNQTITDRFLAAGTSMQDVLMIVIRHNRQLMDVNPLYVQINGQTYSVNNYSTNSDTYNATDLLTLRKTNKIG